MAVRAYVFVTTTNPGPRAACRAIRKIPGVVQADALFGGPPVVAVVEGRDLAEMDAPIDAIVNLPMVVDTETHVVREIEREAEARRPSRTTSSRR
jgi:DNA-binding Lrp family transcriptional regulator